MLFHKLVFVIASPRSYANAIFTTYLILITTVISTAITGHQRLGTEDQDPSDRRRITQVLQALLGRADVDIIGREGITAAHMAAMGDSSKLLKLLADHKVRAL
jgi:ankyrin repeat protein